jgi:nucleoside-diphosphate-sugar epimerase
MMMRVAITGGSGFIGTNLIEDSIAKGDTVLNIDIRSPRNPAHKRYWKNVDLLDATSLYRALHEFGPDVILHMGARTDLDGLSISDYTANTAGVENLLVAIAGMKSLRKIILASSRLVCRIGYQPNDEGDYCPSTVYGESKVIGERLVRDAGTSIPCPWVIVRPTSIWGPWFDVPYKTFFLSIAKGRYVHPGAGEILKSFGFVGNTVYELQHLLDAPGDSVHGKTLYLADYVPVDVTRMANSIQRALGAEPIKTVNRAILRPVAWLGDALKVLGWRNPPLTSFRLDNLLTPMVHDLEPLRAIVGELPYTMETGVALTVDWLRARGDVA